MKTDGDHKKKLSKKEYIKQFTPSVGGYLYSGPEVFWGETRKRTLLILNGVSVLICVLLIICGCLQGIPLNGKFYVLIPYLIEAGLQILLFYTIGRLAANGNPLKLYIYQKTVEKIPLRTLLGAIFAGVTAAGMLLLQILEQTVYFGEGPLFMVFLLLIAAGNILQRKVIQGCKWEEKKKQ